MTRTVVTPAEVLSDRPLQSIGGINALPRAERRRIYASLLPLDVLTRFEIDPMTVLDLDASGLFAVEARRSSVELWLRHQVDARDPILYLQLADTATNQVEIVMFVVNDPEAERFHTDRLPDGTSTHFGTERRNIPEEIRAMKAGLVPGQVRRGLRVTRDLVPIFEDFVAALRHDMVVLQPLAYHNAISFERLGFAYAMGLGRMEWIHREFAPGGLLHRRLDGSTPFRQPGAENSVRGRSWAIHDGIMDMPFAGIKMYKQVGIHAGVVTFPEAAW